MNDDHNDGPSLEQRLARLTGELAQARNSSDMLRRTIVDVALDAVVTVDEASRIVEFNSSAERMFGRRRTDVLGEPMAEMIIPAHLRSRHEQGMTRYLASGDSRILGRRVELEAMHADGHTFPVELTVSEIKFAGRHLFTAFLRDLSDIKRAEQEIARQRDALYQHDKLSALGSLLAGIAHELNNPLSVVVGRAMLMEMDVQNLVVLKSVREIREAAERCAGIVKTFLAMARQQTPERSPLQINDTIHSALRLLDYPLHTADIEVRLDLAADLPAILADAGQISQVFTNLFINAQQALLERPEPRRLHIKTRREVGAGSGGGGGGGGGDRADSLRIEVSDNGPGIPESVRSRIFDPFFTTKPMGSGTGVGLSFCHGTISAHGGSLSHETPAAGGARFVITLPLSEMTTPAPEPVAADTRKSDPLQILIVDDEPEVAELIDDMLHYDGHQTMRAASGNEALMLLQQHGFDIILSDLQMPDLNGPALYARLLQQHPQMSGRIAFITGDALGARAGQFLRDSGCPYLEKPFTPEELLQLVKTMGMG